MTGMASPLVQIFVLSVILELLVIAAPFYMQLTVDEVVARGDVDLMLALALGFGLLTAINVATTALRSHIALVVQNAVHFHMGARLFHHLVRLPLSFFEKRHIGDVLSRFQFDRADPQCARRGSDPGRDRRDHGAWRHWR